MRTGNKQAVNPFTGRWRVVSRWRWVRGWGWVVNRLYRRNHSVWVFTETGEIRFPSGNTLFTGTVREMRKNRAPNVTEYSYSTDEERLHIGRRENEGRPNDSINDSYRVERSGGGDLWIYSLDNIKEGTDAPRFKIRIRRRKGSDRV